MKGRSSPQTLLRFRFVLACTISIPCVAEAQVAPEPRVLNGTVSYAGGNEPAENVSVELRSTEGNLIGISNTTATGWFEFRGLQRGIYVIAINMAGFEPVNFSVDLMFTSSRGNVIYLKRRPNKEEQTVHANAVSAHELAMPAKARELMEAGKRKLYKEKDAPGALAAFREALSAAAGYYEVHYQMAMAYLILGQRENAERSFRKAIEASGDTYGDAEIGLGTYMLDQGDFAGGEERIRLGIKLSPDSWLGHYELGRALLNENRVEDAEKAGLQARSLAPNMPIVYRLLSNIHLKQRNYSALLQDIEAYLKLDSDSAAAIRAQQIREQVKQQIAQDKAKPAESPHP